MAFYCSFYFVRWVTKAICGSRSSFGVMRVGGDCVSPAPGWTWLACICFNITIVLCSTLSLSQKNYRMVRALVTSLLSAPLEKLAGLTWPPLLLERRATCIATTASRPSLRFMWRLALTTAKVKVPSAPWSPSTLQRLVREWPWVGVLQSYKAFSVSEKDKDRENGCIAFTGLKKRWRDNKTCLKNEFVEEEKDRKNVQHVYVRIGK